ncbi:Na+/H+ antiporter [Nocardioides lianchengensis]|uniref:Monovalent cation:H+ antiporter, CPA1 family n=1 Tax=Nocardioides lianchengensis TaxID=1045774 RepID=A0A1G6TE21_9ACTN|nr:Na+/H+ antiporter [Nocardioides lianchengensis]NYG11784.1 CPA1 family monovalent cation:H+ antiporter [Nocardioides lianchengensis]SDD27328.1 monovalent cation:H+ antiporter, CPA1 family [Nocardioides lianchengensis]
MDIALLLCGLAVGVLISTEIARRLDIPAPFLLIAVGVAASYVPQVPQVYLDHDVVLLGLLPPLLYAAAQQTSLVDFRANWRPILMLSVGLVVFTTAGVGLVVHALVPGLPWAVALAIGAVVAPPDAVAATAIARRIGLPRRIVTILEGESLLNDATALVTLRTALAIAAGSGLDGAEVSLDFVRAAGGGVVVGFVFFVVVAKVRRLIADPVTDSAMSLVVPFAAYVLAEELHASGVIAVVVAGLLLGHKAPILQSAQSRIAERLNWRTIAFVLENTVFLLIGLQAWWILEGAADSDLGAGRIVAVCAAVLATVVVLRMVWVFPSRMLYVRRVERDTGQRPPWTFTFLLGWAGMRGVVTLAAAFVIPEDTEYREVLLLIAFSVVAGTLFLQGMSLPWFARVLRVPSPDPAEDALARATLLQQASKAALHRLDELEYDDRHGVVDLIRQRLDQRNFAAWERLATVEDQESPSDLYNRVRLELIEAERSRVLEIRSSGTVAAEVVADVLAMLDVEESMLDVAAEERREVRVGAARRTGEVCAELEHHPAVETATDPVCQDCLDEGLEWVALRQCLECGNVGCCDSSAGQHATRHFHETTHPVMQSAEPGEDWRWCYVHHLTA